jgi:adenylate cyclase
MAEPSLVSQITDWLDDQALGAPDIAELFEGVCMRLSAIGVPIARGILMWSTLHPLFQAENVLWKRGTKAALGQFPHQDEINPVWLRSPMHFMLESGLSVLRRRLTGPSKLIDFPILEDLVAEGYTDYLVLATELFAHGIYHDYRRRGIFVTWASDRESGFTDEELAALQRVQRGLATACKIVIQARIARNISEAYLGRQTGKMVLEGRIRLGDGEQTRALVWYSDLRSSTRLAETMPSADYLNLLNVYFECAARPIIAAGGEVLAFVGDAVLAIAPVASDFELPGLARRTIAAVGQSLTLVDKVNAERTEAGLETIRYGIGLNLGTVAYGNIGVPERLSFSAVGPTVIEVARIEKLTKTLGVRVLATREIAAFEPRLWRSTGEHSLEGSGHKQELFGFREEALQAVAA